MRKMCRYATEACEKIVLKHDVIMSYCLPPCSTVQPSVSAQGVSACP